MLSSGCVALMVAGQMMCFSGEKITCSDQPLAGIETCKCQQTRLELQIQAAKRAGTMSADGSTSFGFFPQVAVTDCGK